MPPTLAVIGDVHATFDLLDRVLDRIAGRGVDAILLVGDLGSNDLTLARFRTPERDARYLQSVDAVLTRVRALGRPTLYVPGNHDLPDLDFEGNIDGVVTEVAGLRVAGIGGAGPARFGFCYEWDEDDVRARDIPDADVLLVHCPPIDTALDHVPPGHVHVGSAAIRERAERHRGVLVCGHIHESPSAVQAGDCLCLNVGGLGHPYGKAQVGFIEGLDAVVHEDLETGAVRRWARG